MKKTEKIHLTSRIKKRFFTRFEKSKSGCWQWLGSLSTCGYGRMYVGNRKERFAHRISFTMFKGKIPEDLVIDHICRNRGCVNPEHLRAVTWEVNKKENTKYQYGGISRRLHGTGRTPTNINTFKNKFCLRRHKWTKQNTYWSFRPGSKSWVRHCQRCRLIHRKKLLTNSSLVFQPSISRT